MAIARVPHHTFPVREAFRAIDVPDAIRMLERLLASMRFVATPLGRDPRLDLLRGFCVFAMIVDHVGGASWLYALTGGNRGPVTAAEGFVFLSGLVLGIASRRRVSRDGLGAAVRSTFARAWTLYALTVILTALFLGLTLGTSLSLWVDRSLLGEIASWPALAVSVLLVRFTWHGTDIMALYALLLVAAPLALLMLSEGHAWRLVGGSWALWLLFQVAPAQAVIPWPIEHASMFPFAAWQVLFLNALVLGYHREELAAWFARESARPHGVGIGFRLGLGVAACGMLVLGGVLSAERAHAMGQSMPAFGGIDLFDKASLGIGRLAAFASAASLAYLAVTYAWLPLERATGWLLIPLGQASLYAYAVHLFVIVAAYNIPPYVGSEESGWELHNTVGQLLLVLVVWAMVKRKVLFGLIPH